MGLLDNILGGSAGRSGAGMSPITMALVGLLAYRTFQGKGRLADMLGRSPTGATPSAGTAAGSDTSGGLGGLLGGLLGGGAAGGLLSGGLGDLIKQFQQHGQGDTAKSWVEDGPNKPLAPSDLERVLGEEKIAWLMQETGLSRDELLSGLSRELPGAVDQLTPDGRLSPPPEPTRPM